MDLTVDKATDGIQRIDVWRALARGCSYPSWHSRSERFQRVIGRSLHSRLASDETQKKDNQLLYSKPKVLFFILFGKEWTPLHYYPGRKVSAEM